MTMTLGGPMFQPGSDKWRKSTSGKDGAHYNIYGTNGDDLALEFLRMVFKDGKANEMNFALFSTSGIHGSYSTLEEIETSVTRYGYDWNSDWDAEDAEVPDDYCSPEVTFVVVQPRIVSMTYGNARVRNAKDLAFLKKLRASSWAAVQTIGRAGE